MNIKILIVDDNENNKKLLSFILKKAGHETIEAKDGEEGVRLAKENLPALIFMDIQMPVMDGVAAMKLLRSELSTSKIPVIALTSYAMRGDNKKFIEEGFDNYIAKPIKVKEVLELVKEYIRS